MKIGLVTITELDNFGNRLQNYALQRILRELGHTTETIPNYIIYKKRKNPLYKILLKIYGLLQWKFMKKRLVLSCLEKQARFEKFDSEYIVFSNKYSTINYIPYDLDKDYDAFIAGSDQIWNSHFAFNFEFNFLTFAQTYKRISYAASFGADHVRTEYIDSFTKYLSEIPFISVRELSGQKIVADLTNKTAPVVLDPTMLLNASEWSALGKKPDFDIDENYILTYYLGSREQQTTILEQIYHENNTYRAYQLIDIRDPDNPEQFTVTPDEFLWLIHHASLMVTDSFHGTVFSILYGTPFCSSPRVDGCVSMQSRLDSLFTLLEIEPSSLVTDIKNQPVVYHKLEEYRRISIEYLNTALNSVEKTRNEQNL